MNISGTTYIASVILPVILLAILLVSRYIFTSRAVGQHKAGREILDILPWILVGLTFALSISRLGKYGWFSFLLIYEVYFMSFLINLSTWHLRKKQAGTLLINIGKVLRNQRLLISIFMSTIFAVTYSSLLIHQVFSKGLNYHNFDHTYLAGAIIFWSSVIMFVFRGLSTLEFRENGICYMFSFMKWERVTSYSWEKAKNNILLITFQPRFPIVSSYWRLLIPLVHKDTVNQILAQHLTN